MGLFRRRPSPEVVRARQDEGIAAFWSWWLSEGRATAASTFDHGEEQDRTRLGLTLAQRVSAIDADLAFETGAGRSARHVLVVTAAGDPEVRDVARRWLAGAPPADDSFEYADTRQPVPDPAALAVALDEHRAVDLASARVVTAVGDGKVHVELSHPEFASLPDEARGQITFLFLDALLGEAVVEDWVGHVAWASAHPADARPALELPALIDRARAAH